MPIQRLYEVESDRTFGRNNPRFIIYYVTVKGVKEHVCVVLYNEKNEAHSVFSTFHPLNALEELGLPKAGSIIKGCYAFSINLDVKARTQITVDPTRKLKVHDYRKKEFPELNFAAAVNIRESPRCWAMRFRSKNSPLISVMLHHADGTKADMRTPSGSAAESNSNNTVTSEPTELEAAEAPEVSKAFEALVHDMDRLLAEYASATKEEQDILTALEIRETQLLTMYIDEDEGVIELRRLGSQCAIKERNLARQIRRINADLPEDLRVDFEG